MNEFKSIELKCENQKNISTELLFEIASARVEKKELIRLTFDAGDKTESNIITALKKMKYSGTIQFFATVTDFEQSSTAAVFLLNKYPNIFDSVENSQNRYVYIKL